MPKTEKWEDAEQRARDALGLVATPTSGSQWFSKGDSIGTDTLDMLSFMLESKSTESKSYSVKRDWVAEYRKVAELAGKLFALHIEFINPPNQPDDYILMEMGDFVELMTREKSPEQQKAIKKLSRLINKIQDEDMRKYFLEVLEIATK